MRMDSLSAGIPFLLVEIEEEGHRPGRDYLSSTGSLLFIPTESGHRFRREGEEVAAFGSKWVVGLAQNMQPTDGHATMAEEWEVIDR
ncbi:MAG: hypothetical protein M5U22_20890 [Thermoleophilia bacterium]|nr:hypothetical protein [Thermoleophilia bacterium]